MRITHFIAKPLPGKIAVLVGLGLLVFGVLVLSARFSFSRPAQGAAVARQALHPFTITSPDFHDGGALSRQTEYNHFGCSGSNIAPKLQWTNVPAGTKSFALLVRDYDAPVAGGWDHWIVYNIPASTHHLDGKNTFTQGKNSYGSLGYGGPCPPANGETHHYLFLLYATDLAQVAGKGLSFDQVVSVIRGHVLGATSLIGTYKRPQ